MSKNVIAAVAVTAALALSACGSDSADTGTNAGSSASSSPSTAASDSKARVGDTVEGKALASRILDAMEKAGSGKMTMETGKGKANGEFVFKDGRLDQRMTMPVSGATLETVTSGGIIYIKGIPGASAKPWVEIDPKADDPMSRMMAGFTGGNLGDPRAMVKAFDGVKTTVTEASGDTTAYEASIDPARLLGDGASKSTAAPSLEPVKVTYVLDAKDLPTEIRTQVSGQSVTVTFSDWGAKVMVEAPPADQVGTFEMPSVPTK
jgi:hypothetical protein